MKASLRLSPLKTTSKIAFSASLVCGIVLLLVTLLVYELKQSHQRELKNAEVATMTTASVIERELLASVDKIDLIVQEAQFHAQAFLNGDGLPAAKINPTLKRLLDRVPGVLSLRIANEEGRFIFDAAGELSSATVADRNYFQAHKTGQASGLLVEGPVLSRITNVWTVTFSRGIYDQDGMFRGIVSSTIPTAWLTTAFTIASTRDNDSVTLFNTALIRIARIPEIEGQIGKPIASTELQALLKQTPAQGSFSAASKADGIERIYSYKRVGQLPIYVVTGRGREQALSAWRHNAGMYAVGVLLLLVVGIALVEYIYRSLKLADDQKETRYKELLRTATDGIHILDVNGDLVEANESFYRMLGYDPLNCPKLNVADWDVFSPPDLLVKYVRKRMNDVAVFESRHRRSDGSIIQVEISTRGIKFDGQKRLYCASRDITGRKESEATIKSLAFFDPLTHLPNRRLLRDRLEHAMAVGIRNGTCGALLFIDLDNFKTLNDSFGHDKGDLLLQQVAQRLTACVREADSVARLGGDEFVVVLENLTTNPKDALQQTKAVGEKILAMLSQTYSLGELSHNSTASIGITLFSGVATSIDTLLKQADLAMYKSKETGRNRLHFFDPSMQTVVMARVALEADLRLALQHNQFVLHYQAQVEGTCKVTGAEALVRWQHPLRGLVSPLEFIPLAEETGLILPLGDWVLHTACQQLAQWALVPELAHLRIAVNVSAQQFHEANFVAKVLSVLHQTGANPARLKLELTESLLVDNVQDTIDKMTQLQANHVSFALDDFGTGFSSLSYLKRLPLNQLKIDQTFVRDVLVDNSDAAIVKTIVALAQSLGMGVIAEGVETVAQRDFLAASGCHTFQGYLFSRPLPVESFIALVQRG